VPALLFCDGELTSRFLLHQIEAMRKKVSATDPALCVSAFEWDAITVEQFKQANLWTTGCHCAV